MLEDLIAGIVQASVLTRERIDEQLAALVGRGFLSPTEAHRLGDELWRKAAAERDRVRGRLRESSRAVGETLGDMLGLASREAVRRVEERVEALEKAMGTKHDASGANGG